ncbi:MAG: NADH-quinone oxidoreductase subunit M [Clostridia bacterium]|nr:NADH-quinone oxidoreductase subunit M [Clostridia bacterium]
MDFILSVPAIVVGLFAAAVLAYLLTKANKILGALITVLGSGAALAAMLMLKGDINSVQSLGALGFKLTDYGWFFSVLMLLIFFSVSFFNLYWMKKIIHPAAYNFLYLVALAGTVGAFTAKDFIGLFIFWETIVWASMFIIPFGKSRNASVVYYAFSAFGSLSMLFGILYLYSKTGSFDIQYVLEQASMNTTYALVAFITIGIAGLVKIGVFPFHLWLPKAHGNAPDTFSPILSGGLVKAGGFAAFLAVIVMPSYKVFASNALFLGRELAMPVPNYILVFLGAVSIVVGTLMAIKSEDFKKLIAYSSVANGGYIIIGIAIADSLSVGGAFMHMFAHALASAAAFLSAAAVVHRTGTTKMSELGGLIHRMPLTYLVYLIAIISMAGIPPMSGFISKWMLFQSMIGKGMVFTAAAAFFGSIGSFLYVFRPLSAVFLGQLSPKHESVKEAPFLMQVPMIGLSLLTLLFGVFPNIVLRFISDILKTAGLDGLTLNGLVISGTNGQLNPSLVSLIFGIGFFIALIIFIIHPKSRKVDLMDTYTASEFIYTPELLHYSYAFYAPFERLYENAPSTEKWYAALIKKIEEAGQLVSYTFFNNKPRIIVFWMVCAVIALLWGGSL